jgi:hypothetical protein
MRNVVLIILLVLIGTNLSQASSDSCVPIEVRALPRVGDPPKASDQATAIWCNNSAGRTAILVTLAASDHPWSKCENPFPAGTWPDGDLVVVDKIETLFTGGLSEDRFESTRPEATPLPDRMVNGPAILAGPGDSGSAFICRSGLWYRFAWH